MPQALTVTWPPTALTTEQDVTARAVQLLTTTVPLASYFEDFNVAHRQASATDNVNGTVVADATTGGAVECRSSAAPSSRGSLIISSNVAGYLAPFPGGAGASFYMYLRVKPTTAFTAQTTIQLAPAGGGAGFALGLLGSVSATNWACSFTTGGNLISTVAAVNGTYAELEVVRVGTTTAFYVNRTFQASANAYPTAAAAGLAIWCSNGTEAVDRRGAFDAVGIFQPRLT